MTCFLTIDLSKADDTYQPMYLRQTKTGVSQVKGHGMKKFKEQDPHWTWKRGVLEEMEIDDDLKPVYRWMMTEQQFNLKDLAAKIDGAGYTNAAKLAKDTVDFLADNKFIASKKMRAEELPEFSAEVAEKFRGRKFTADQVPGGSLKLFLAHFGVTKFYASWPVPPDVKPQDVQVDLSGDLNTHFLVKYPYYPVSKKTGERSKEPDTRYAYTAEYGKARAAGKWERSKKLDAQIDAKIPLIRNRIFDTSLSDREHEAAAMLYIMLKTGLRRGNNADYQKSKNRGTSTLSPDNVTVKGSSVDFHFTGKEYMNNTAHIDDADLGKFLLALKKKNAGKEFLWDYPSTTLIEDTFKNKIGLTSFKVKDMRSLFTNRSAAVVLSNTPLDIPKDLKAARKYINDKTLEASEKVAALANNKKSTARGSYISPALIIAWVEQYGGAQDLIDFLKKGEDSSNPSSVLWELAKRIVLSGADRPVVDPIPEDEDDPMEMEVYPLPSWLEDEDTTKGLVLDLTKAKTVGSTHEMLKRGKHGAIVIDDGKTAVRYVSAREAANPIMIVNALSNYRKKGHVARFEPPDDTKQLRSMMRGMSKNQRKVMANLLPIDVKLAERQLKQREPQPLPQEIEIKVKDYREVGNVTPAVSVLRNRVADWTPPSDYRAVVDPLFEDAVKKLITMRREAAAEVPWAQGQAGKQLASAEYAGIQRQIDRMKTRSVPTAGLGKYQTSADNVEVFADFPHHLGFNPTERPMSYLLSTGWDNKDAEGENHFNRNEQEALLYEFAPFVYRQAADVANKVGFRSGIDSKTGKMQMPAEREDIREEAVNLLYRMARGYHQDERKKDHGDPTEANNFAVWFYGSFPLNLTKFAVKLAKRKGSEDVFAEELEEATERNGRKLTPATRVESPEEHYRREEGGQAVTQAMDKVLSPVEKVVVLSRMNIINPQAEGVREGTVEIGEGKDATKVNIGAIKTWQDTHSDLVANAKEIGVPKAAVQKISERKLSGIFDGAMQKLRSGPETGFTAKQEKALADLASLQRLYMEGIRHYTWTDNDAIRPLIIHPEPVSQKHVDELTREWNALNKLSPYKMPRQKYKAALARKREVSIELANARAQQKLTEPSTSKVEFKRRQVTPAAHSSSMEIDNFWRDNPRLATALRLGSMEIHPKTRQVAKFTLPYAEYMTAPNMTVPEHIRNERFRSEALYATMQDLAKMPSAKLSAMLRKKTLEVPEKAGRRLLRISDTHYRTMIEYALKVRQRPSLAKSFVIPNYYEALDGLIAELRLWEMNGY